MVSSVAQNLQYLQDRKDQADHEKHLEEVMNHLDTVQCGKEEAHALNALVNGEKMNSIISGEWDGVGNSMMIMDAHYNGGGIEHYLYLLDMAEMEKDLSAFESAEACHELFAEEHFDKRISGDTELNKRSEMKLWCAITAVGDDYATASSDVGKVYIPKHLFQGTTNDDTPYIITGDGCASVPDSVNIHAGGVSVQVIAQFKGFENSRNTAMPWRAKRIVDVDVARHNGVEFERIP